MMPGGLSIQWHGVTIHLLPGQAAFLPESSTLLIADVHLGKPAAFRAAGIPVPESVTLSDLSRISDLLAVSAARRLVVLGDLIHDQTALLATTADAVRCWRNRHAGIEVDLVVGNHDRRARSCEPLGFRILGTEHHLGTLRLTHEPPLEAGSTPTLCGHIHPAIPLRRHTTGGGKSPCFWFSGRVGILPAFGAFTGGVCPELHADDLVFAAGRDTVLPVTPQALRAAGTNQAAAYDRA
jgi:uncharacterized protein